jgi:hypothetical protein
MLALGQCRIEGAPVHLADRRHVLGRFQSALDLEAGHPTLEQIRDLLHRREILRGEQVAFVPEITQHPVDD